MEKNNNYDIPKDWFTSEEALKRQKRIKEHSDKMIELMRNNLKIDNNLLKRKIGK